MVAGDRLDHTEVIQDGVSRPQGEAHGRAESLNNMDVIQDGFSRPKGETHGWVSSI